MDALKVDGAFTVGPERRLAAGGAEAGATFVEDEEAAPPTFADGDDFSFLLLVLALARDFSCCCPLSLALLDLGFDLDWPVDEALGGADAQRPSASALLRVLFEVGVGRRIWEVCVMSCVYRLGVSVRSTGAVGYIVQNNIPGQKTVIVRPYLL